MNHIDTITSISFSPINDTFLTSHMNNTIILWNYNLEQIKSYNEHISSVQYVCFSYDGLLF